MIPTLRGELVVHPRARVNRSAKMFASSFKLRAGMRQLGRNDSLSWRRSLIDRAVSLRTVGQRVHSKRDLYRPRRSTESSN